VFSCSKIEQKQLNTWVSFQSAEQPLLGQFSVSGNNRPFAAFYRFNQILDLECDIGLRAGFGCVTMVHGVAPGL
jgi:hypothetical protein